MKKILLSQGKSAIVDDEDYDFLMQWKWSYNNKIKYAQRAAEGSSVYMHRVINKTPKELLTDHINMDGLDNRRCNLRNATKSQNMMNQKGGRGKNPKYRGVSYCPDRKKWQAGIVVDGKRKALGRFLTEKEAALAYNKAAKEYYGEYFSPNEVL